MFFTVNRQKKKMLVKSCALIALVAFAQVVRAQDQDSTEELDSRGSYRANRGSRLLLNDGHFFEGDEHVSNKVVPGTVKVLPTQRSYSNSVKVVKSLKEKTYVQNSESTITQNNVIKQTKIHVHTDRRIHKPKLINVIRKHHHTEYVINTQPIKTNINIERQQDIIKPEVKNIIVYQNSENLQRNVLKPIVRNEQKFEHLPTIREPTHNDGTDVIGNPLNLGSINLLNNGHDGALVNEGNSRRHEGSYGLERRAGEEEKVETETAPAEQAASSQE